MATLALKIPPPVVALSCAAAMYALAAVTPAYALAPRWTLTASLVLAVIGIGFDLAGLIAFRRQRTTINPLHPEKSSALVCSGIYRISRNPMYVGMALLLLAWAVYLQSPVALLGLAGFIAYITRFQIIPEEQVLAQRFGVAFEDYRRRVRRWL